MGSRKTVISVLSISLFLLSTLVIFAALQSNEQSITQGFAPTTLKNNLLDCMGGRVAGVGEINSSDGKRWIVPSSTEFDNTVAPDLYNECNDVRPANLNQVNIDAISIMEVDADGELITAYLFADNYFELYVNDVLVGTDPVPFTPFNSNVIRFRANRPMTLAVKLVDWEENLGLGTEDNRGNAFHAGDGGFIATFYDSLNNVIASTGPDWKAQSFYIAPLTNANDVTELGDGTHSTDGITTSPTCSSNCFAVHYEVPNDWASPDFDDSIWPNATTYTEMEIGVDNKPSYTKFIEVFSGAGSIFIWSSNVVLDNEVLLRYTIN
jgi:hypothetical protein